MDVGIVSYGGYVPRYRIKPEEIGRIWGVDGKSLGKGLMIYQKSVPSPDEDVVTIATEAARYMMDRVPEVDPKDIGAIYVGSESHPYAVKPTATIVAEAIEATPAMTAADMEFACKAGTAGILACMGLVGAGMVKYGVAIGADTSQGAPGDALEYSASAGGAAYLIGSEKVIARINKTLSFTTDTPDFWRREGQPYPKHGGRFTGEPAYFRHITSAAKMMLEAMGTTPEDYKYAVFHQPNGKFPTRVAKQLGFTDEQIQYGLLTPNIGNTYSGAVPLTGQHPGPRRARRQDLRHVLRVGGRKRRLRHHRHGRDGQLQEGQRTDAGEGHGRPDLRRLRDLCQVQGQDRHAGVIT